MDASTKDLPDPAAVLADVAFELARARPDRANLLLHRALPPHAAPHRSEHRARPDERRGAGTPLPPTTQRRRLALFLRDGFVDRWSGRRLVYPSALCALAHELPGALPLSDHRARSHQAHSDLFPSLDHVLAHARGGTHAEANWVTTSLTRNERKGGASAVSLGWTLRAGGDGSWDGLLGWYVDYAATRPYLAGVRGNRGWHEAAMGHAARAKAA